MVNDAFPMGISPYQSTEKRHQFFDFAPLAAYKAALPDYLVGAYADRLYDYANAKLEVVRATPSGDSAAAANHVAGSGSGDPPEPPTRIAPPRLQCGQRSKSSRRSMASFASLSTSLLPWLRWSNTTTSKSWISRRQNGK